MFKRHQSHFQDKEKKFYRYAINHVFHVLSRNEVKNFIDNVSNHCIVDTETVVNSHLS